MGGSSAIARIVTAVIGVVVVPIALALIATGGNAWLMHAYRFMSTPDWTVLAVPTLLMIAGVILLAGVVLTGLWSSAGLLAAGVVAVPAIVLAMFPGPLLSNARLLFRLVSLEVLDGLVFGLPLIILSTVGLLGVVAMYVRRRPRSGGALAGNLIGGVVALLAVPAGVFLLLWGVGRGQYQTLRTLSPALDPLVPVAIIGGLVLLAIGLFASRWSPFGLVLPALFSLVMVVVTPATALRGLPTEIMYAGSGFFIVGGGIGLTAVLLTFTVVLLVLRRRDAKRVPLVPAQTEQPAYPGYPPQAQPYPHAQPYPPQAPPAS